VANYEVLVAEDTCIGGCAVVRRGRHIAVVRAFLVGCAVVLLMVGCAGVRSGAPQEKGHTEAANKEQARSPEATSPEEGRCGETRSIDLPTGTYITNDVPGCPNGGLLSGTDGQDKLLGEDGEDEVRGLGGSDELWGGFGKDVVYGGPGADEIYGAYGEDVLYGGEGNDIIDATTGGGRDKLYCGEGTDQYWVNEIDYVDSSCEKKRKGDVVS
jgi:uncharacterized protein YceK